MNIVWLLAPLAALLGMGFAGAFAFMASRGQFEDLETPAYRILPDDEHRHEQGERNV